MPSSSASSAQRFCDNCEVPTNRQCSGCAQVWYCSKKCQNELWPAHIFTCAGFKGTIKTSYHLFRAIVADLLPTDAQTLEDYGFERLSTQTDRGRLLGVYTPLLKTQTVHPRELHQWRVQGRLLEEIKIAFEEKLPATSRNAYDGYYQWLLDRQYILDDTLSPPNPSELAQKALIRAWISTGGSSVDSPWAIREQIMQLPASRRLCHEFYEVLFLDAWNLPPISSEVWVQFGFCACRPTALDNEDLLGSIYRQLVKYCIFEEFVTAFESRTLVQLMDSHGLGYRSQIVDLEDVLSTATIKPVWYLKQFVEALDWSQPAPHTDLSLYSDYGFMKYEADAPEVLDLKGLYRALFLRAAVRPLELHEAATRGNLVEFMERFIPGFYGRYRLKRLLKYPLSPLSALYYSIPSSVRWTTVCMLLILIALRPGLAVRGAISSCVFVFNVALPLLELAFDIFLFMVKFLLVSEFFGLH